MESISQLTALQRLVVMMITDTPSNPSSLGMLGQLTSFQLRWADCTDWSIFEGCAGLQALHLGGATLLPHTVWVWVFQQRLRPTLLMQVVWWRSEHALALYLVAALEMEDPQPLPFQQLTRLQLEDSHLAASDILVVISEMPQLEILEVLDCADPGFELLAFDATALARLSKLRLVDLSGSVLWADTSGRHETVHGDNVLKYLPVRVVQHLVSLQRATTQA
jgi:hypothetical protein